MATSLRERLSTGCITVQSCSRLICGQFIDELGSSPTASGGDKALKNFNWLYGLPGCGRNWLVRAKRSISVTKFKGAGFVPKIESSRQAVIARNLADAISTMISKPEHFVSRTVVKVSHSSSNDCHRESQPLVTQVVWLFCVEADRQTIRPAFEGWPDCERNK